jgi:hypothetical protein
MIKEGIRLYSKCREIIEVLGIILILVAIRMRKKVVEVVFYIKI